MNNSDDFHDDKHLLTKKKLTVILSVYFICGAFNLFQNFFEISKNVIYVYECKS